MKAIDTMVSFLLNEFTSTVATGFFKIIYYGMMIIFFQNKTNLFSGKGVNENYFPGPALAPVFFNACLISLRVAGVLTGHGRYWNTSPKCT